MNEHAASHVCGCTETAVAVRPSMLDLSRPISAIQEVVKRNEAITSYVTQALKESVDYGKVPGTDKNCLFKAGAERLIRDFAIVPVLELVEKTASHNEIVRFQKRKKKWLNRYKGDREFTWEVEDGEALGFYRYVYRCSLKSGDRTLAQCDGVAATTETKYADRPRDCENTVCKMSQKRAIVGATLLAFGLSDRFTQDMEDIPSEEAPKEAPTKTRLYEETNSDKCWLASELKKRGFSDINVMKQISSMLKGRSVDDLEICIDAVSAFGATAENVAQA